MSGLGLIGVEVSNSPVSETGNSRSSGADLSFPWGKKFACRWTVGNLWIGFEELVPVLGLGLASFLWAESANSFSGGECLNCTDSSIMLFVIRLWLVPVTSNGLTDLIIEGGNYSPIRSPRSSESTRVTGGGASSV